MLLNNVIFKHQALGYCKANISIKNGVISAVEVIETAPVDYQDIEFYVTPGFVNCHLHPNQLYDRRLLDELSIVELLHQMHGNYQKDDEDRYTQALFVLMEAIKSGATSIYAVASNPYPVLKAFKAVGVKGAVTCFYNDQWEGHGDSPGLHNSIEQQFKLAHQQKTDKVDVHIGSASVQSASNELLILIDDLAKQYKSKVNIHVSEGIESVLTCKKNRGTTPIRLLEKLGILSKHWNLIHAVNIDEDEIALIAKTDAKVIHCPVSNGKTGVGIAPIMTLLELGVTVGLGTDACSNNNTNNILNEAYVSTILHSAFHKDPKVVTKETVLDWITTKGHKIIGSHQKHTIEVGEPADLLLWSLNEDAFVPVSFGNFDSTLINNAPDIKPHTVLIDGKPVVKNYHFTVIPEEEIRSDANNRSVRIAKQALESKATIPTL